MASELLEKADQATSGRGHLVLQVLARIGYASRGVVYVIVGVSAMLAAFGRSDIEGSKGALAKLLDVPLGGIMLVVLAIGLVGYSAWRFVQSVLDADDHGYSPNGLMIRFGLLCSSVMHLGLAFWAGRAAWRGWVADPDGGSAGFAQWVMSKPAGQWLVIGIGLGVIIAGICHAVKAYQRKYEPRFEWTPKRAAQLGWICILGLYTRSVILVVVGCFFLYAAYRVESDEAGGMSEALEWIQGLAFGPWLLAGAGGGLLLFGGYSLIESVYRRVNAPQDD